MRRRGRRSIEMLSDPRPRKVGVRPSADTVNKTRSLLRRSRSYPLSTSHTLSACVLRSAQPRAPRRTARPKAMTLAACAKTTTHLAPVASILLVHASTNRSARSCRSRRDSPRREGKRVELYVVSMEFLGKRVARWKGEEGRGWRPVLGLTVEYLGGSERGE